MRVAVLVGLLITGLALAGCGDDTDDLVTGGTGDTGSERDTTTSSAGSVELAVTVSDGSAATREATLSCGDTARGTGWLAEAAAAEAACELLKTDTGARDRLIAGAPEDRMCTQVYGGPEVAEVVGSIEADEVRTTVDRKDGCGIADWELLQPLLGPPAS